MPDEVSKHTAQSRARTAAIEKLADLTKEYMKDDPQLRYDAALLKAIRLHPQLARSAAAKDYSV